MTGHSRGGALANLVGAKLIDEGKRVFAYTFAAPAVTDCTADIAHGGKYSSIFNVINTDDFVTYFPLSQWGFTRYGRSTSSVSVSGLCQAEWESRLGEEYKRMLSPEAPLEQLYEIAPTKNLCYEDPVLPIYTKTLQAYPDNTLGYYRIVTAITGDLQTEYQVYQTPMFLMKYFAAVAAGEAGSISLILLDVVPNLEATKLSLLSQIIGVPEDEVVNVTFNTLRIERPHLPDSYYLLTSKFTGSNFEN